MVPPGDRRRSLPDRGHLVADRDRRHDDRPAARGHPRSPARRRWRFLGSRSRSSTIRAQPFPMVPVATWCSPSHGHPCCAPSGVTTKRFRTPTGRASRYYFAGDGAKKDADGDLWLLGRVDDVMNVSGHRISTTEVESALVSHSPGGRGGRGGATDEMTGQGIVAFVIPRGTAEEDEEIVATLRGHVATAIGPIAKPRQILVVSELPKTPRGRSCADCCAMWPRTGRSGT